MAQGGPSSVYGSTCSENLLVLARFPERLAALGALGTVLVVAGAAAAATLTRPPIPAMLVAAGTTLALIAGILLVPVLMAGLAA